MDFTRRRFLIGGAAFGAFAGNCFAAADAFGVTLPSEAPRLRFGVLSDLHIVTPGMIDHRKDPVEDVEFRCGVETFKSALEWYRAQGVDAVVIAGDMTDQGIDLELMAVADAWRAVFPDDKLPDGRRVEKIFVTGNHDVHRPAVWANLYPDKTERKRHVLRSGLRAWWNRAFRERYEPIFSKTVNGYTFIGSHWDTNLPKGKYMYARIEDWLAANGRTLDPALPFFYVQHPHLKNTCYGPWAWGHDRGAATKALSAWPNAIAFSGHSHYTLADERTIWQGAFTSVGAGSLAYTGLPVEEHAPAGCENSAFEPGKNGWRLGAAKLLPRLGCADCRQGMLWSVYGDRIVVRRRDFFGGMDVGCEWVMPLPCAEPRPFAFAEHAKRLRPPQFPEGAELAVSRVKAKTRGGGTRHPEVASAEKDALEVVAPAVVPDEKARLFKVEFTARTSDGRERTKLVLPEGFNQSVRHEKARRPVVCRFALDELGAGEVRLSATPLDCFNRRGRPLYASAAFASDRGLSAADVKCETEPRGERERNR